ncbi:hypothetical protein C8J57DRAFT_1216951 [Mycena rebaudengoi]|nr:hypothetical protein C8J57DRAFT_1216951 [Mycena rebaudengoi]
MSVLAQATTSTSSTPAYPSSTYPTSTYPVYAAPPTMTQQQQRLTLVIPSSTTSNATSNANANSPSFHTTPASGPANVYHAAPYTSLGSAVTPSYSSVSTAHTPYSGGSAQYSSGASGVSGGSWSQRSSRRGRGNRVGLGMVLDDGLVVPCDGLAGTGVRWGAGSLYATPVLVNGAAGRTAQYTPGTSSPMPQYATPPQYTMLGATPHTGQGVVEQQDLYFYTLASSPVLSASTSSSSAMSESLSLNWQNLHISQDGYLHATPTPRPTPHPTKHPAAPRRRRPTQPPTPFTDGLVILFGPDPAFPTTRGALQALNIMGKFGSDFRFELEPN